MTIKTLFTCLIVFLVGLQAAFGQKKLSGTITDELNQPIPYAQIFVKNSTELRTTANENGVYTLQLFEGEYYLVFNAPGYAEREAYITVQQKDVVRDIQLFPKNIQEIAEVEITTKSSNPGREIMLEVVKRRDKMNQWNYAHTSEVSIKATEFIDRKEKKQKKKDPPPTTDPFELEKQQIQAFANNINLCEVQLKRDFSPPNNVKEYRNAYEVRGSDRNLYYTTTVKSNFNFFENTIQLADLNKAPISSPISGPGILSYKYRLVAQYQENGKKIHKIKIIPRMSSTSSLSGYIYVIDSIFIVQKIELSLDQSNLLKYDHFTITQTYDNQGDSLCVLREQTFLYGVKYKDELSNFSTVAQFSNYNFQPNFSVKHFNNEVAITTQEAYDRDTTFWNNNRKIALTPEEQRFVIVRDSINDLVNRKEYLDSVDSVFNKITFIKVAWFGIEHRNRARKTQWSFNSVAAMARPLYPAGPRVSPGFSYFKKWKDQRTIDSYSELSIGILNNDLKGSTWFRYMYDPFHQGKVGVVFSNEFDAIVPFDAITQVYKRSNFIEATKLRLMHNYEHFNGFYVDVEVEFNERRSLTKYNQVGVFDSIIPNDQFTEFKGYQALLGEITVSYVPGQKFMREPNRKVILGSKWPTFYAFYQRGIPKLFGSDINHEYGIIGMLQSYQIGTIGTSSYHIRAAKFLSAKNLKEADFKYQRRSTPFWFSNPLYSYQNQDSSLPSREYNLEAHFVHHDNGAIINKIPFMKKTGIGLVFGASALYVSEYKFQYAEVFGGLERNFKFSKRRLRVGIYGVASDGNKVGPQLTYKISFAVLDDRNMKWNF